MPLNGLKNLTEFFSGFYKANIPCPAENWLGAEQGQGCCIHRFQLPHISTIFLPEVKELMEAKGSWMVKEQGTCCHSGCLGN